MSILEGNQLYANKIVLSKLMKMKEAFDSNANKVCGCPKEEVCH